MCSSRVYQRLAIAFFLVGYIQCQNSSSSNEDPVIPTVGPINSSSFEDDEYHEELNGTIATTLFEFNQLEANSTSQNGTWDIVEIKFLTGAPIRPCPRNQRRIGGKCKMVISPCPKGHIVVDGKCKIVVSD